MKVGSRVVPVFGLAVLLTASTASRTSAQQPVPTAAAAQEEPAAGAEPAPSSAEATSTLTPEERKRRAIEERVAEYLANKERRRLENEALEQSQPETIAEPQKTATAETTAPAKPTQPDNEHYPALPRELAQAQAAVRKTHLASDPTIERYLTRIDRSQASPQELAAFGNFLADTGMNRLAQVYYEVALRLEKKDPMLWNNMGTIYRQLGEWDKAEDSFARALNLNPANAMAHYNLGAVFDEQRKYDQAVREYRIALTLDPLLGDPEYNPSAANNERLLAVKLLIYQEKSGNVGLPLVPMGEPINPRPLTLDE